VAFCRLLAGSVLREFDQHQVIYILTKSKHSIEYKPVSKCSTGPETFRKAIVDKKIHILRAVRLFACLLWANALFVAFLTCCARYRVPADMLNNGQFWWQDRKFLWCTDKHLPVTTGQLFVLLFKEGWLSDTQILSFCMFQYYRVSGLKQSLMVETLVFRIIRRWQAILQDLDCTSPVPYFPSCSRGHGFKSRSWYRLSHCYFPLVFSVPPCRFRTITLTLRWLMSYIYGAPILDVSRSHTTTQHSR